jgi:peroxiredoxin
MKITVGTQVPVRELTAISGASVPVPDPGGLVHLQFRRFAGCPVCNVHLRSFAVRHAELAAAGVREVAVFHAPADELRPYVANLPFELVADPDKRLYAEFGVESAPRALLDPRAWPTIVRGVLVAAWGIARHGRPVPPGKPHGGRLGLPADFLVGGDGRILAAKYGEHAADHWSVDDLLALARNAHSQRGVKGLQR